MLIVLRSQYKKIKVPKDAFSEKSFFFVTGNHTKHLDSKITKNELFLKLYQNKFFNLKSAKCNNFLTDYILRKYYNKENVEKLENIVKNVVKFFVSKCILKWKASHRIYERFVEKIDKWLQANIKTIYIYLVDTCIKQNKH